MRSEWLLCVLDVFESFQKLRFSPGQPGAELLMPLMSQDWTNHKPGRTSDGTAISHHPWPLMESHRASVRAVEANHSNVNNLLERHEAIPHNMNVSVFRD